MRAGGLSHYCRSYVQYILYTETKLLILLIVWTLLKIHINKGFVLVLAATSSSS